MFRTDQSSKNVISYIFLNGFDDLCDLVPFYYRHFTIPIVKRLYFLCKNSWEIKSAFYYRKKKEKKAYYRYSKITIVKRLFDKLVIKFLIFFMEV